MNDNPPFVIRLLDISCKTTLQNKQGKKQKQKHASILSNDFLQDDLFGLVALLFASVFIVSPYDIKTLAIHY